jgi:hypothetical protein
VKSANFVLPGERTKRWCGACAKPRGGVNLPPPPSKPGIIVQGLDRSTERTRYLNAGPLVPPDPGFRVWAGSAGEPPRQGAARGASRPAA